MEHQAQQVDEGPSLVRRYNVERSCVRCHERKVRCNKNMPCSACLRSKVPCRYPGPERTKRRSQRQSAANSNLMPRLERLERVIASIPSKSSPVTTVHSTINDRSASVFGSFSEPVPDKHGAATRGAQLELNPQQGLLLKDGASTRYINELLFSSVLDKESELQSAIDSPNVSTPENGEAMTGFDGLISNPLLSTTDVSSGFPSRRQATQLWQIYLNNVDPLIKILHIPTTKPVIFAAINDPKQAPPDVIALLFSIFFAAVASSGSPEAHIILGHDRQSALRTYKRGLEISLHMASFLDSPTIRALQAMALYQMCRRNISGGRSGWTVNGLLIRTAQLIGLHRDGEHFKLPLFECEIRRRLWWQIIGSDTRVAEDHGLLTGGLDSFCDTKLPVNVDDSDLSPDMQITPAPKSKWTEMTMFLVAAEMNRAVGQISRLSIVGLNSNDKATSLKQILESVKGTIENNYLQYCDPNIPIQKSAILLGRVLMGKLEVFIRQQSLRGLSWEDSAARASEQTLSLACDTIEVGIKLKTDELLSNFHWLFTTYPQYHLLTYILWHLCVRPATADADRAWSVVNESFESTETPGWPRPGPKWNVIRKLREKAINIHRSYLSTKNTEADLITTDGPHLQGEKVGEDVFNMAFGDGELWDFDSSYFPDMVGFHPESDMQTWNT